MAIVVPKGSHGAYREQIVLDARSVVHAPAGKTHPEAATLPMNGLRRAYRWITLSLPQNNYGTFLPGFRRFERVKVMVAFPIGVSISADVLLASDNDNPAAPKSCGAALQLTA
jgi:NADPH:quinone reductase